MLLRDVLRARQAVSLASSLTLCLVASTATVAQDETPAATEPAASPAATTEPAASPVATTPAPGRFKSAKVPRGAKGQTVQDVISGGPGYIAVGGGSNTGLDLRSLIWVSEDGQTFQSVPLFGDAANGLIEAVAQAPGGGFVAVGRDFAPGEGEVIVNALVWRSDDGVIWERVQPHESFRGSVMYDVTTTADGLVAVGCEAQFHCSMGRVWTSPDGAAWELASEIEMAPFTVAASGVSVVAGGTDDAIDLTGGRAVLASTTEGGSWGLTDPMSEPSSQIQDTAERGEGIIAVGAWWPRDREGDPETGLYTSSGGQEWQRTENDKFKGFAASVVASTDDFVMVVGTADGGEVPVALWSSDLEAFKKSKFPKGTGKKSLAIDGGGASADGSLFFATGREDNRPAIWYSQID